MIPDPPTLRRLADVLGYPAPDLAGRAAACAATLGADHPAGAARMARFAAFAAEAGLPALEEAYTAAFDLAPVASPYVGDQLFGATRERSYLLSALRELQREAGIEPGPELPDHVAEVLRLAAAALPDDVRADLVRDGLVPSLQKMLAALEGAHNPWADVVAAAADALAAAAPSPSAEARPPRALEVLP